MRIRMNDSDLPMHQWQGFLELSTAKFMEEQVTASLYYRYAKDMQ